jgi:threonine dehydrogenase-like Zn-dependent dehydrogenase
MKAVCWYGIHDVRVVDAPDPQILNPRDAIVRVTATAICGSDLHLYDGYIPTMKPGDILGHEFMGEVVEVGPGVDNLAPGDRVVVPFPIGCGNCYFCKRGLWSLCDNSNPNAWMAEQLWGYSPSGIYGYSHLVGGYAGGQAEYVRVPFADVGPIKVPDRLSDEQVLFLSDILPTGWMAAEHCDIQPGDTIAVWGCGPVGLLAIRSAFVQGAARVIAIDQVQERLQLARAAGAETIDFSTADAAETLKELTGGRGPDACIDAVGMEADGKGLPIVYDRAMQFTRMETDRGYALRQAILACRKGGTVSVAGVYGGFVDMFPMGAVMNRSLTIRSGQTHVQRYMAPLLEKIDTGDLDPSFVISHRVSLADAPDMYRIFRDKLDGCTKVVMTP